MNPPTAAPLTPRLLPLPAWIERGAFSSLATAWKNATALQLAEWLDVAADRDPEAGATYRRLIGKLIFGGRAPKRLGHKHADRPIAERWAFVKAWTDGGPFDAVEDARLWRQEDEVFTDVPRNAQRLFERTGDAAVAQVDEPAALVVSRAIDEARLPILPARGSMRQAVTEVIRNWSRDSDVERWAECIRAAIPTPPAVFESPKVPDRWIGQ